MSSSLGSSLGRVTWNYFPYNPDKNWDWSPPLYRNPDITWIFSDFTWIPSDYTWNDFGQSAAHWRCACSHCTCNFEGVQQNQMRYSDCVSLYQVWQSLVGRADSFKRLHQRVVI